MAEKRRITQLRQGPAPLAMGPAHLNTESWRADLGTSSTARGYGYKWQQAREGFLRKHPLCVMCEANGLVRASTVVDHKQAHRGDQALFWDRNNWQALCKPCHDKHAQKRDNAERGPGWRTPGVGG